MLLEYLGEPVKQLGIGNIYPITIQNIERFKYLASKYLIVGKTTLKNRCKIEVEFLLDFIMSQYRDESMAELQELFSMCLRKPVVFIMKEEMEYGFRVEFSSNEINRYNFDTFRDIVLTQNILFEPFTEEDDLLQEWLELARKTKERDSEPMDLEAVCQFVSVKKGIRPNELLNYTYYQVLAEYQRLLLDKSLDFSMLLRSQGNDVPIPNVGQPIDLHQNPDESLIKKETGSINGNYMSSI